MLGTLKAYENVLHIFCFFLICKVQMNINLEGWDSQDIKGIPSSSEEFLLRMFSPLKNALRMQPLHF